MKKTFLIVISLKAPIWLLLFVVTSYAGDLENDWQLKKDKDGIKIYLRESAEYDAPTVKSEFKVQASVAMLVKTLGDGRTCPPWSVECAETIMLNQVSRHEYISYSQYHMPWPLSPFDVVTHVKISTLDDGSTQMDIEAVEGHYPDKGYDRLNTSISFNLLPQNGHTLIRYQEQIRDKFGTITLSFLKPLAPYLAHRDLLAIKKYSESASQLAATN